TGNGYATEALKLISHYAFNSLKLNRLEVDVAINNPKSIALLERVGFQEEGLFREYTRLNGVFLNHRRFSLLSTDMAATRL
ncbi:MAG TPA: GNAT family N-acetyltransferase, partial [Fibrobacter sp.]|nr:GNAT family N-acetyltransferase [Fibrobacter sp.]